MMNEPIIIRLNSFVNKDDFRRIAEDLKKENENIIVIPAECEVLLPKITRCKDCEFHRNGCGICDIWHAHTSPDGFCHRGRKYGKSL